MEKLKHVMRLKNSHTEKGLRNLCEKVRPILGDSPIIVELGSYMGESSLIFSEIGRAHV